MENVDLAAMIRGVVESMTPTAAARGVDLQLSSVPPVPVLGDVRRLEQVFFNLIDNALKFTPKAGRVAISGGLVGGEVEVEVRDTGVGIEPEFLPLVFDRFRQGDAAISRTHGGLGLGLSIAKQLVAAHRGTIRAESAGRGRGAAFKVRLPLATPADDAPTGSHTSMPTSVTEAMPWLEGVRVLVVDDEVDVREMMTHALEVSGASVRAAANVPDALEILEQGNVDVLLADIAMPREDGLALIKQVRSSPSPQVALIPAAAVTALMPEAQRALAAGFHLQIGKPFEAGELVRIVEKLARHQIH
jgi:CheY-like chemotaxis protein/anti-sigma regulatory factor (Ser/Thr protein kinase)